MRAPADYGDRMRAARIASIGLAAVAAALLLATPASAAKIPDPLPCDAAAGACWDPEPTTEPWQIQFQGRIDLSIPAPVYDIDVDSDPALVDAIHAQGDRAICYISAGSWEPYRSDKGEFPKKLLGRPIEGFEEERWLDIRRIGRLRPIMEARMDDCVAKGYDAIDPDNVDGYQNRTGFPLKSQGPAGLQRLPRERRARARVAVGLKNDLGQVEQAPPLLRLPGQRAVLPVPRVRPARPLHRGGQAGLRHRVRGRASTGSAPPRSSTASRRSTSATACAPSARSADELGKGSDPDPNRVSDP